MLVLLAVSTLAAALLPPPEGDEPASRPPVRNEKRSPTAAPRPQDTGLLLVSRMALTRRAPKTARIELGDQLRLSVMAPFGADVEIPGLGLTGSLTPFAPAQFDLLATRTGRFAVRAVETGRLVGTLLVGRPGSGRCGVSTPATPRGRGSTPSCDRRGRPVSTAPGRSDRRP
jgi:hypothetical protein